MLKSKAIGVEFESYLDLKDNRGLCVNMMRNPRLKERSKLASNVEVWSRNKPEKYSTQNRTLPHCCTLTLHSFSSSSPSLPLSGCWFGEREEERNPGRKRKEGRRKRNAWIQIGPWKLEETVFFIQFNFIYFFPPKKNWKPLFLFIFHLLWIIWETGKIFVSHEFYILCTMVHGFGGIWLAKNSVAWRRRIKFQRYKKQSLLSSFFGAKWKRLWILWSTEKVVLWWDIQIDRQIY